MPSQPTPSSCCDEFADTTRPGGVGRRAFLRGAAVLGGAAVVTAAHGTAFTETSYAATGKAPRVLVLLSMRGACDGLSLVVPHGDPTYYAARPSIAVPSDRLLAKDGFFGLHPSLSPLLPWWTSGKMAAIHATGLPSPNRSHFSAMEEVEDADPGSAARTGWLNRLVGRDGNGSPIEAIQYGPGVPNTVMVGPAPVLVAPDADSVALSAADNAEQATRRKAALNRMWGASTGPLANGARESLSVVEDFAPVTNGTKTPANGAVYPANSDLAKALASTARTIRADVGAEIITVDHGSWDHHTWIGKPDDGILHRMASEFAKSVAAFLTDLGPLADKVTIVTVSEFGRRVKENANQGLDHGYGNVMFTLGAGVKGGKYYGTWMPVANTVDADLLVTTDYRSVLSEVVVNGFGASTAQVFPGFTPTRVGVMQGV